MKRTKVGMAFGESLYSSAKFKKYKNHFNFDSPAGEFKTRNYLIWTILIIVLLIFGGRLFYLQVIASNYYKTLADQNRTRTEIIHAPRGIILDRNSNPLVYNIPGFREKNGKNLIFLTSSQVTSQLANNKNLEIDSLRFYPFKDTFAHVLGYVGQISPDELKNPEFANFSADSVIGKMGIEQFYDADLRGSDGEKLIEVDATGRYVRTLGQTDPIPGKNIVLTLDKNIQNAAYNAMSGIKKGAVIVSTPTGEILAMVNKPSFDPNLFTLGSTYKIASNAAYSNVSSIINDSNNEPLLNRSISGQYPPGSTFKLVVAATALQDKLIDANYTVQDNGIIKIGDFSFSNWYYSEYGKTEGTVDVVKAIKRSNDIFFYTVGHLLGVDRLSAGAAKFGLGKTLGIDLNGEEKGFLPTSAWKEKTFGQQWYLGDDYHYGIGQGYLLTTPLQVNSWTQAIANGGKLYQPHLLKNQELKILDQNLLTSNNFGLIREGMIEACSPGGVAFPLFNYSVKGEGLRVKIDNKNFYNPPEATEDANLKNEVGVSIACKTGTAEQEAGSANPDAWITLFAPAYNPQIIVTVLVEDSGEGSTVAAPIAKQVLDAYFKK